MNLTKGEHKKHYLQTGRQSVLCCVAQRAQQPVNIPDGRYSRNCVCCTCCRPPIIVSLPRIPFGNIGFRFFLRREIRSRQYFCQILHANSTSMDYMELFLAVGAFLALVYYYAIENHNFWEKQDVPGPKPIPMFGNFKRVFDQKIAVGEYIKKIYDEYKHSPMVGIFARKTPILVLNDPELIKDVLITDFSKFGSRGRTVCERAEPLINNLFDLEPKRWRPLRTHLSPLFTSAKLKDMFRMIVECSEHLGKYLENATAEGKPVDIHDLTAKFTTDVIGTCVFGIETNSLTDGDSDFRRMGKQIFTPDYMPLTRMKIKDYAPKLYDLLGYVLPYEETTKFFINLTKETIKFRREHKVFRNDFIDTLIELQNHPAKMGDVEMTDIFTAAQTYVFFAAGFETSSTTMSNMMYELAFHQDIQDKLRQEINETYKIHGDFTYESVKGMKYFDRVFRETLRKYPPVPVLTREATEDYKLKGSHVSIPKGSQVWVPVYGIQRDPDIYPNPDAFVPERFSEEAVASRHPMYFLPFGTGPRNCIGARFGVFQAKLGIVQILRNYKVEVCDKTPNPYRNDPRSLFLTPLGKVYLKLTKLKS